MPGMFIDVEVDAAVARRPRAGGEAGRGLPGRHLRAGGDGGTLAIVEENLDECVLCRLCIDAAPQGTVRVVKLYDEGAVL